MSTDAACNMNKKTRPSPMVAVVVPMAGGRSPPMHTGTVALPAMGGWGDLANVNTCLDEPPGSKPAPITPKCSTTRTGSW